MSEVISTKPELVIAGTEEPRWFCMIDDQRLSKDAVKFTTWLKHITVQRTFVIVQRLTHFLPLKWLHCVFIYSSSQRLFGSQGFRERDILDCYSKGGKKERDPSPCPTFHHSSPSQLQSFGKDQWKAACQQSLGYIVYPALYSPNSTSSQHYKCERTEIHF